MSSLVNQIALLNSYLSGNKEVRWKSDKLSKEKKYRKLVVQQNNNILKSTTK